MFAYEELASEGLITPETGSGTYIAMSPVALRFRDPDGLTLSCTGLR